MATNKSVTLHGMDAIAYADRHGLRIDKATDPIESWREGLTVEQACAVAREDAGLVYVEVPADIYRPQITALRDEAREAGDDDMAEDCEDALAGDRDAASRCMEAICEAIRSSN